MLKLYSFDRSPFGWKTKIVLAEKNIPFETIIPENKNESASFAKLNPFRLTPVLVLEDGKTIYESTIIDEYLEEKYPNPPMLPKESYERARIRMLEDTTDLYLYKALSEIRNGEFTFEAPFLIRKKASDIDQKALEESKKKVHEHLGRLENELEGKSWFGGDLFSLADAGLIPLLAGYATIFGFLPSDKYKNLNAWCNRVKERPSYKASAPKEPPRIKSN